MAKAIYFDMDGTIANLYACENWLERLRAEDATPYATAQTMLNMSLLARYIHKAQAQGYIIGIVSWLSKESSADYDKAVAQAKNNWLKKHLPSVVFDEIHIVPHSTPKASVVNVKGGVLFDDEQHNRTEWQGMALAPQEIINFFKIIT